MPYSLHDAHINHIDATSEQITLWFDEGYYKPVDDDCLPVKGQVKLEGVDVDFCYAFLTDLAINYGKFSGEKFTLRQFSERFPKMNFEIIDETYGYNQSKFSGFIYEGEKTKECRIEIYHFGAMTYITEE